MKLKMVFLANLFGWLEKSNGNPSKGRLGRIYDAVRLNAGAIYNFLLIVGLALFTFFFLFKCMGTMINRNPRAFAEFKSYMIRWALCLVAFMSVFTIIGLALKFGGLI